MSERLLTISSFGRAVGLPASALRHYAREGVLEPCDVDPASGYRYYSPAQLSAGVLVRRLREASVPLPLMREVVDASPEETIRLVESLVTQVAGRWRAQQDLLGALAADLGRTVEGRPGSIRLPGARLARALRQVLRACDTAAEDVAGVVWDLDEDGLSLAATDRYWLAARRLPDRDERPAVSSFTSPPATEAAAEATATRHEIEVRVSSAGVVLRAEDGAVVADLPAGERKVPDLRLLVASRRAPHLTTGFDRRALLSMLTRSAPDGPVPLIVNGARAALGAGPARLHGWSSGSAQAVELLLRPSLLHAAASTCVGEEVLVRGADDGGALDVVSSDQDGLTTLVMPMRA